MRFLLLLLVLPVCGSCGSTRKIVTSGMDDTPAPAPAPVGNEPPSNTGSADTSRPGSGIDAVDLRGTWTCTGDEGIRQVSLRDTAKVGDGLNYSLEGSWVFTDYHIEIKQKALRDSGGDPCSEADYNDDLEDCDDVDVVVYCALVVGNRGQTEKVTFQYGPDCDHRAHKMSCDRTP